LEQPTSNAARPAMRRIFIWIAIVSIMAEPQRIDHMTGQNTMAAFRQ
jgi:hypothetical protein